ncbi:MAG: DNA polymerase III subunit gamma/tau [Anaerolineae bacterium]
MSQAHYRKWRPARFDDVVGQEHITRTLQNSVAADRVGHAYLFCGPRGTGTTTSARLLAKAVNCLHEDLGQRPCNECSICKAINNGRFLDLIEIDAASNTGVDDIRDLRDKINFAPSEGRFKVYIIDEVHMLSTAAFNALLKTLEEPPPHAKFILATTEEHKVPMTIKSRCQQFNFRLLTTAEIKQRLNWLAEKENLAVDDDALALIADQGAGSIRDAESLLDQLVMAPGDTITLERAQQVLGTVTNTAVTQLVNAWLNSDGATGLALIHEALASGADARQFSRQMVAYLRQLLLMQAAGRDLAFDGPSEQHETMLAQSQRAPRQGLISAVKRFTEAALTSAGSWQPQLPLELAFIELLPDEPVAISRQPRAVEAPAKIVSVPSPAVSEKTATSHQPPAPVSPPPDEEPPLEKGAQPSVTSRPSSDLSLDAVKAQWRTMTEQVGEQQRNLPALLTMGKPLALEGSTIILGFDFPIFHKKFMDTAGAPQLVGETFSRLLGTECNVRSVITSEYTIPVPEEEFRALADELGGVVKEETGD